METKNLKRFSDISVPAEFKGCEHISLSKDVANKEWVVEYFKNVEMNSSEKFKETKLNKNGKVDGVMIRLSELKTDKKYWFATSSSVLVKQLTEHKEDLPFIAKFEKVKRYWSMR